MTHDLEYIKNIINSCGYIFLDEHMRRNYRMISIEDSNGYKYYVDFYMFKKGIPPLFVHSSNPFSIENISRWIYLNNKNFELCQNNVYINNSEDMSFHCFKCDEIFSTSWASVSNGCGCSVCEGRQVKMKTSFGYLCPDLMIDWSPNNIISPYSISEFSAQEVLWKCNVCQYEWPTPVSRRSFAGSGCPQCDGLVVSDKNRLSILFPEISEEWDYEKNGSLTPDDVSFGSMEFVWWLCKKCGKNWQSTVNGRTNKGYPCKCKLTSRGEFDISQFLLENDIGFIPQHTYANCRNRYVLRFDIYIPNYNLIVEYMGEQHFFPVDFGGRGMKWAKKMLEYVQENDLIKENFCIENNIPILKINYWQKEEIPQILTEYLNL